MPKNIVKEIDKKKLYPNNFEIVMSQGNDELYSALQGTEIGKSKTLITNPYKMDTLFLTNDGEKAVIHPKYCELYDGKNASNYNLQLSITSKNKIKGDTTDTNTKYDLSFRIDKIMLIPVQD